MIELPRLDTVGRFWEEFDLSNYSDVVLARAGQLAPEKVRRVRARGVVDTGAALLVLPATVVKQLGLRKSRRVKVRYADGRRATRDIVSDAYVELRGRDATFNAIVEPKREDALIGAIVLEALDLLPDCTNQCLVPRDPNMMTTEVE